MLIVDYSPLFRLRYLVRDTLPSSSKAMTGCISRLREALNLLPRTDSQSLGESIAATLSAGRSVLHKPSSFQTSRNGEQQDPRQQQVAKASLLVLYCTLLGMFQLLSSWFHSARCLFQRPFLSYVGASRQDVWVLHTPNTCSKWPWCSRRGVHDPLGLLFPLRERRLT